MVPDPCFKRPLAFRAHSNKRSENLFYLLKWYTTALFELLDTSFVILASTENITYWAGVTLSSYIVDSSSPSIPSQSLAFLY